MSTQSVLYSKRALVAAAVVSFFGFALQANAQVGLALVPMREELKIEPGGQLSGALKLSSESGAKTRIRTEADDFFVDKTDTPQFERNIPHEAAYSCKNWLTLNPMEIELDQGGFLLVRYTVRVPADATEGSYACAATFSTLRPASEATETGMGMRMAVRIVSAFYIQVGNPAVAGSLKEIKLEEIPPAAPADATAARDPDEGKGKWQAVVELENDGKIHFRPKGTLEVLDAGGKTVEKQDFPSIVVLRERTQPIIFRLKTNLQPGHYQLQVNVDIGTGEIQRGTAEVAVEAPSPTLTAKAPAK
jgi:hypothetical protein